MVIFYDQRIWQSIQCQLLNVLDTLNKTVWYHLKTNVPLRTVALRSVTVSVWQFLIVCVTAANWSDSCSSEVNTACSDTSTFFSSARLAGVITHHNVDDDRLSESKKLNKYGDASRECRNTANKQGDGLEELTCVLKYTLLNGSTESWEIYIVIYRSDSV